MPLEPEVPLEPEEPFVPLEPEVPDVPLVPDEPACSINQSVPLLTTLTPLYWFNVNVDWPSIVPPESVTVDVPLFFII